MEKYTITTKHGNFEVEKAENGTNVFYGKNKVTFIPNVEWWDKDKLVTLIEEHNYEPLPISKTYEVNKENAKVILEELTKVFGNENKGFYSSRLKQCINKMK